MSTSITIRRYLEKQDIRYKSAYYDSSPAQLYRCGTRAVAAKDIAKAILLKDLRGMVMAVIPATQHLEMESINRRFRRKLAPAKQQEYSAIFADCNPNVIPPLGEAYGLECIVDDSLLDREQVYFVSGNQHELLCISSADFQWLHNSAWYGNSFYHITTDKKSKPDTSDAIHSTSTNGKQKSASKFTLPALTGIAADILKIHQSPDAKTKDLLYLAEKDAALSSHIIQYAKSRFYGIKEPITSVRQAISRVLGYDLAVNIALGITICRSFKLDTVELPGLHAYWRHATYSAVLAQGLAYCTPQGSQLHPGTSYLCGLLHNIGILLIAYLYPKKLIQLNQAISLYPETTLLEHESLLLGTNHTELGRQLMQAWGMPPEITVSVTEHHNLYYDANHAQYANLLYLVDALLKRHHMGDAAAPDLPRNMLDALRLSYPQAIGALEKTLRGGTDLDILARKFAA